MFDENQVVNRLLSGDSSAADSIVNQFDGGVYRYCLHFLGGRQEAEDATTDVFLRLFAQLGSDATETSLREWIMRITVNVCMDWPKHHRTAKFQKEETLEDRIHGALQRLVRQQRAIILLRDLNGLDEKEIATVLEIEEKGVRQRLARARNNLCDFLLQRGALLDGGRVVRERTKAGQHYHELCSRYVDGNVTEEEKQELLAHIQECESCAAYLQDLTQIGRELAHMMDDSMPEGLKEDVLTAVQLQAEKAKLGRRRRLHLPLFTLIAAAVVFVLLVCSGTLGGLFSLVGSNDPADVADSGSAQVSEATASVNIENLTIPDSVAASSYAFAIAATGGTQLPELSTQAELIAMDDETGTAYYAVDSDVAAAERLTKTLESFGYQTEPVYDNHILISGDSSEGLIILLGENEGQQQ